MTTLIRDIKKRVRHRIAVWEEWPSGLNVAADAAVGVGHIFGVGRRGGCPASDVPVVGLRPLTAGQGPTLPPALHAAVTLFRGAHHAGWLKRGCTLVDTLS